MLFTAPSFLFLFLPAVLAIYALIPQHYRRYAILLFNLAFYVIACWSEPITIVLALLTAAFTYSAGYAIAVTHQRRTLLVALSISLLAFFTYRFFYSYSADLDSPYYPLGATFYLLASISYLIDIYRNDAPHAKNIGDLLLYMLFFPTLIVGPVIRYKDFGGMIAGISLSLENFSEGVKLYISGFFKRISIAAVLNFMLERTAEAYGGTMSIGVAVFGLVCLCAQAWFTFSGYSDMARGLMYMFGIPHTSDFLSPFTLNTPSDYLRRFFISLNRWIEDYLVYPVLRLQFFSGRMRRILAAAILCFVPAFLLKLKWYMFLPVLPVFLVRIGHILRESRRRGSAARLPLWLRRTVSISSSLLIFVFFWLFVAVESPTEALTLGEELMEYSTEPIPYAMYAVFSYSRYLVVGLLGLLFLLPLRSTVAPYLEKLPRIGVILIRTVSLVMVMGCFCFSILHFLPQFPEYAVTAFENIVL